jgi:hypothetical protein
MPRIVQQQPGKVGETIRIGRGIRGRSRRFAFGEHRICDPSVRIGALCEQTASGQKQGEDGEMAHG